VAARSLPLPSGSPYLGLCFRSDILSHRQHVVQFGAIDQVCPDDTRGDVDVGKDKQSRLSEDVCGVTIARIARLREHFRRDRGGKEHEAYDNEG
jgi:hypothetical protein